LGLFGYEKVTGKGYLLNSVPDFLNLPVLLECKNGKLFKDRLFYDGSVFRIRYMVKAEMIQHMLVIGFKENTLSFKGTNVEGNKKLIFDVASRPSKLSAAGLILLGDIASMEAGRMAMQDKVDSSVQQWVTTINMLIALSPSQPSMSSSQSKIYCSSCGTENSLEADFCFRCGKRILKA